MIKRIAALGLVAAIAAIPACFTSRRSDAYACATTADCDASRVCLSGYCVVRDGASCPAVCASCDLVDLTCRIDCASGKSCGDIACPPGFDCTIRCGAGACGKVDCSQSLACDVSCSGGGACREVTCGAGRCDVACSGANGCAAVDCRSSCACDVSCNNGNSCGTMQCPMVGATACTRSGQAGAACDSTEASACSRCP